MADAYSTIVQQSLEKKNQEIQHNVNAASNAASMASSIVSSLSSLIETGVKLGKSVHDQNVSDETTRALNAYKEQEAYGKFDLIDMDDENSGYEADPEKAYANRLSWLDKELSTAYSEDKETKTATGYRYGNEVKKTMLQYLAGQKASIIEDKNATNYNKIQSAISGSIDYLNSPFYDSDATNNSIDFTISNAFKDDTHINVGSLLDVEDYGIKELAQNYIDTGGSVEADYALRYALVAYSVGESKASYNSRKEANFESDFLNYKIGRWARAYGEEINQAYLDSGCDPNVVTNAINGLNDKIINEGIDWDTGETLKAYELGTSGINTAISQATTYLNNIAGQTSRDQQALYDKAATAWDEKYESETITFTTEAEAIEELQKLSGGNLNATFAKENLSAGVKSQIKLNAKNAKAGELFGEIIDTSLSVEERQAAIDSAVADGYLTLFSSDSGFGLNNLLDDTDNTSSAPYMLAYNKKIKSGMTPQQAFVSLFGSTAVSSAKTTSSSSSSSSKAVDDAQVEAELYSYNVNNSYDDFMSAVYTAVASGEGSAVDDEAVNTVLSKYGISWDDYEKVKTGIETLESDKLLMKAITSVEDKDTREAMAKSILTTVLTSQLTGTNTATAAKNAATTLDNIRANVEYGNAPGMMNLGYIIQNVKSANNTKGYDEAMVYAATSEVLLNNVVGKTNDETYNNLLDWIDSLETNGYATDEVKAFKEELKFYKDHLTDMTREGFLNFISPLRDSTMLLAQTAYETLDGSYELDKITYTGSGYVGKTIDDVIKDNGDNKNISFTDDVCKSYYASGKVAFGKDCGDYSPSDALLATGAKGSTNYYNIVGDLVNAGSEIERNRILEEDAPKCLTPEAIESLKGLNSVNLIINSILGMENWNFQDQVAIVLGDSEFSELASSTNLSDWMLFIGDNKTLAGEMSVIKAAYDSGIITKDQLNERLSELANETAQEFICKEKKYNQTTATNTFSSHSRATASKDEAKSGITAIDNFNPITSTSNTKIDGVSYFTNWKNQSKQIASTADCDDVVTNLSMKKFIDGDISEMAKSFSGALTKNDIDENLVKPYTVLLAMELSGIPTSLTEADFDTDFELACNTLFGEMQSLEKADDYKYLKLHQLTQALDKNLSKVRTLIGLGYDLGDYTMDVNGNIISPKYGIISQSSNGDFIATGTDGKQTNLNDYSGKTQLKGRSDTILGEYSKGKDNLFGNVIFGEKESLTTIEGINQVKSYNEKKSKTNSVTDYSGATEMVGKLEGGVTENMYNGAYSNLINREGQQAAFEELTGDEITNRYMDALCQGEDTDVLLAQLSDGMRDYVQTMGDDILAQIAIAAMQAENTRYVDDGVPPTIWELVKGIFDTGSGAIEIGISGLTRDKEAFKEGMRKVLYSSQTGKYFGALGAAARGKRSYAADIEAGSAYYYDGSFKQACEDALERVKARGTVSTSLLSSKSSLTIPKATGKFDTSQKALNNQWQNDLEEQKKKVFEAGNK